MTNTLMMQLRLTGERLIKTLDLFGQAQVNVRTAPGSWTPGQVVDHILKSGNGVFEVLHGACTPAQRAFDEKEPGLKAIFLDFSTNMQSPAEILPSDLPLQKEPLLNNVEHLLSKLVQAAADLDLTETCLSFEFPGSGPLTRFEWLSFFVYHTERHINQLLRYLPAEQRSEPHNQSL